MSSGAASQHISAVWTERKVVTVLAAPRRSTSAQCPSLCVQGSNSPRRTNRSGDCWSFCHGPLPHSRPSNCYNLKYLRWDIAIITVKTGNSEEVKMKLCSGAMGSTINVGKPVSTPVSESSAFNQLPSSAKLLYYQRWGRSDPNKTTDRADWNMRLEAAKRGHLGKISLCPFWWKNNGMPEGISQEAGSKNQIWFSSHLHCCSLQDAVEASNFTWL